MVGKSCVFLHIQGFASLCTHLFTELQSTSTSVRTWGMRMNVLKVMLFRKAKRVTTFFLEIESILTLF